MKKEVCKQIVDASVGGGAASDRLTDFLMELSERIDALEKKNKSDKPKK